MLYCTKGYKKYGWILNKIGFGAYTTVYDSTEGYAVKVYKCADTDLLREISLLQVLNHKHIIKPVCITIVAKEYWLYLPIALGMLYDNYLDPRIVGRQLYSALAYCHNNGIIHRDVKPQNILVYADNNIVLADFGLARFNISDTDRDNACFSSSVCSLWWRAPELLLGSTNYTGLVDVWAAAVVLLELLGCVRLQGENSTDQLYRIFELIGLPTTDVWPNVITLPKWDPWFTSEFKPLTGVTPTAEDFLKKTLIWEPSRINAEEACRHSWFIGDYNIGDVLILPPIAQTNFPYKSRAIMIEWLFDIGIIFKLYYKTVLYACELFDKYISMNTFDIQTISVMCGLCCYIANKIVEIQAFTLEQLASIIRPVTTSQSLNISLDRLLVDLDFNTYANPPIADSLNSFINNIGVYAITGKYNDNVSEECVCELKMLPGNLGKYYRSDKITQSTLYLQWNFFMEISV